MNKDDQKKEEHETTFRANKQLKNTQEQLQLIRNRVQLLKVQEEKIKGKIIMENKKIQKIINIKLKGLSNQSQKQKRIKQMEQQLLYQRQKNRFMKRAHQIQLDNVRHELYILKKQQANLLRQSSRLCHYKINKSKNRDKQEKIDKRYKIQNFQRKQKQKRDQFIYQTIKKIYNNNREDIQKAKKQKQIKQKEIKKWEQYQKNLIQQLSKSNQTHQYLKLQASKFISMPRKQVAKITKNGSTPNFLT